MVARADKLQVVNEQGAPIRVSTRDEIHEKGLLHREVHVWLYTPRGELIFQHRGPNKDTFPDLLDATAGGHVEMGMEWENSAIKKLRAETGVKATKKQLRFIDEIRSKTYDEDTKKTNNVLRRVYALIYNDEVASLSIGTGKALGFEAWPMAQLLEISKADAKKFIASIFDDWHLEIISKIHALSVPNPAN